MTHIHTGIALVRERLLADGRIEAFDAVYTLTDPDGKPHRITRLAAVIHTLRHREGWDIETVDEPGKLAVYILRGKGTPPVRVNPLRAVKAEERLPLPPVQPVKPGPICPKCGMLLLTVTKNPLTAMYLDGQCLKDGKVLVKVPA